MELNGVANIDVMIQMAQANETIDPQLAKDIKEQLDLLERYMLAYKNARDENESVLYNGFGTDMFSLVPKWHEVRENKEKYPNMKEFINGVEKNSNKKEEMDR